MEPSFEDRDAFRFIDTIVTRAMKTRQQSCSKWRKGKVGKDGAENKSGTVCNDAVTQGAIPTWNRPLSRSPNISLYKNQLLLFAVARPDPTSIQWMSTPGWPPPRCSPPRPPPPLQRILQSGSMSCGDAMHRNRNEWTTITWCSNHFECIRQCE